MTFKFALLVLKTLGYSYLVSGFNSLTPKINPVRHNVVVTRRGAGVALVCLGHNVEAIDTIAVWKFKGQDIKDTARKRATEKWLSGRRGNFTLHITNVSEKDVGRYTCSVFVSNFNKADKAEGVIKLKLHDSERWHRETFALPMPDSGCPQSKGVSWSEGSLRQNTEDTSPLSNWSRPNHLKGPRKNNEITQHFCVKEKKGRNVYWPAGKYCIYKKGQCPLGFSEGWIKWDDEDTKNNNLASGDLPDGTYGKDTVMYFCCRSDGSAETPIELSMRQPFVLLKHSTKCQAVIGMCITEEWLFWDCEDKENKNLWSGMLPESLLAKDVKLYFCYYFEK